MGRAISGSDTTGEDRRKTVQEEKKVRKKKKKCKKELTDLHRKLCKSRKILQRNCQMNKLWQGSFVKLLHRFADLREEYDNQTKIDGKLGKVMTSKKMSNRILPRHLAGIYRNGAAGKLIRRSQTKVTANDINNARLQGNVRVLVNGYDTESEAVVVENGTNEVAKDPLLDSAVKNILQPTPPGEEALSPILCRVDGRKLNPRKESIDNLGVSNLIDLPQKSAEKKKPINYEKSQSSAMNRYEELCKLVSAANFEGPNFPQFATDPLTATKKKLRAMYAESFHNQYLSDMTKRGQNPNEPATSSKVNEYSSDYAITELPSANLGLEVQMRHRRNKKEDIFVIPERNFDSNGEKNAASTSQVLFDLSLLTEQNTESKSSKQSTNSTDATTDCVSLKVNPSDSSQCKDTFEISNKVERLKEKFKPLFMASEAQLPNDFILKKHCVRRKHQRVLAAQLLKHETKKHPGKGHFKSQHVTSKNLKHIPAILRRCNTVANNNNNNRLNLFDSNISKKSPIVLESAPRQDVLFTPRFLEPKLHGKLEPSKTVDILNVKDFTTCVIESPSLRNDEICFLKNVEPEVNEIFLTKKNPAQKTILFTKKDSRNIGHCLHLNNLITDGTSKSNVCLLRKSDTTEHDKIFNHRNCQRVATNCYRSFRCSQNSENSSYGSEEFKESSSMQTHQKPCEKLLLRRVQSKCNKKCPNSQHVCYVVVDQCKGSSDNNVPCQSEKLSQTNGHYCHDDVSDVGILKGVQNLHILPVEERESRLRFTNDQCVGSTVMYEQQPIKYLAVKNDSRMQKIPIYVQSNKIDDVDVIKSNVNYRMVSCPQESAQKVILVPTREEDKVLYVKHQSSTDSEDSSHPREVILYQREC